MRFISQPINLVKALIGIMVLASLAVIAPAVEKIGLAGELGAEAELEKVYHSKIVAFWNRHGERRDLRRARRQYCRHGFSAPWQQGRDRHSKRLR
nr:hypothetical protein [Rhizobium halophilum]